MSEVTDHDLLERFKENGSDEAFAILVERYVGLVHSVALRHTSNSHHAEEISQAVFVILARKAGSLGRNVVLSGWLYTAARLTAANFVRAEMRHSRREREAFMQSTAEEPTSESLWQELSPCLDEAMEHLQPIERDALVLRYFENKSLPEVGAALGMAERAAQKRVSRALEKLRGLFAKRGISATVAILAAELSAHSVQAAPAGLATKIAVTVAQGSAVAGSTLTLVKGTLLIMNSLKTKLAIGLAASVLVAAGVCAAMTHHSRLEALRNEALARQEKLAAEQAEQAARAAEAERAEKAEQAAKAEKSQSMKP